MSRPTTIFSQYGVLPFGMRSSTSLTEYGIVGILVGVVVFDVFGLVVM